LKGALIPVLHEAQSIYGYLPEPVQRVISEGLNVPLTDVYGVVTFYTQFTMEPKGEIKVAVCLGTACYVKGANNIIDRLEQKLGIKTGEVTEDGKFSLDATRCLGACGLAPVMMVNDDVYGKLSIDEVDGIINKYMGNVE
jgi:NADP-reducing hydrogenase subunit HndA